MAIKIVGDAADKSIGSKSIQYDGQLRPLPKRAGENYDGANMVWLSERKQVLLPLPDGTTEIVNVQVTATSAYDTRFRTMFPGCDTKPKAK